MRIKREHLLPLVNYIKAYDGFEDEGPIQYGTQYVVNKVVVDIHFSTKKPTTFTLDIKNDTADPLFASLLRQYAEGIAE